MTLRRPATGLLLLVMVVALVLAPAGLDRARAQEQPSAAFVPGTGAASATVAKARLFYAGFSLQVALGLAATTYENQQSRSLGGAYDLSSALSLVDVSVPELSPVSIDSNAGDAETSADLGAGPVLGSIALRATTVPAASSEVRLADVDLPGLLRVEGGRSTSSSSIVDGTARRAEASVTVGSVDLLGGIVSLEGLRWDVVHQTGADPQSAGTFSLGRLSLAGVVLPVDLQALDPVLDLVNGVLAPTGLVLAPPEVVVRENGAVDVTPLRVGILNSPLGADVLGPIVAGVRPLLVPLYGALADASSTLGLTSLVADLGLGVLDGSGGLEIAVGGATARTDDSAFVDPLAPVPTPSTVPLPDAPQANPPAFVPTPAPVVPAVPAAPGAPTELRPTSSEGPARCVLAASPRRQGTCRGTNLPGAVAVVAVVASAVAIQDVRLRRRRALAGPAEIVS